VKHVIAGQKFVLGYVLPVLQMSATQAYKVCSTYNALTLEKQKKNSFQFMTHSIPRLEYPGEIMQALVIVEGKVTEPSDETCQYYPTQRVVGMCPTPFSTAVLLICI
jgi:hypothetical protein